MNFELLVLLLFLYGVINFVLRSRRPGGNGGEEDEEVQAPPVPPPAKRPEAVARPAPQGGAARLEDFLRDFERKLEEASGASRGPLGRAGRPLPGAEEVEERTSLEEAEPEIASLEVEPAGRQRVRVDLDEVSAAVAARRRKLTEEDARPLTAAGHAAFDARIREGSEAGPDAQSRRIARLREAVVLREVLGPPRGLQ